LTLERKGVEVISLDVRPLSTFTDFFVIATGMVDVHLKAIADHILEELKKEGIKPLHIEGYENMSWVLIDYVDVVVHLFLPNTREFYAIERLWGEAKVKHYE
jgi:ribosome-associated protein